MRVKLKLEMPPYCKSNLVSGSAKLTPWGQSGYPHILPVQPLFYLLKDADSRFWIFYSWKCMEALEFNFCPQNWNKLQGCSLLSPWIDNSAHFYLPCFLRVIALLKSLAQEFLNLGSTNPTKVHIDSCYTYTYLGERVQENHEIVKLAG